MARHRHPFSVGLPLAAWPDTDRKAWDVANRDGDLLTGRGAAAHWRPKTRTTARKAYGNWLRHLQDHGLLDVDASPASRLTAANLRSYLAELRRRTSHSTVLTQLAHLSSAIAAMDPAADRSLIKLALSRLTPLARPVRDKRARLMAPTVLLGLGQCLMAEWQVRQAHDPRLNAMDYRDGLMIAFLALCPIRLANLAAMRLGIHLVLAAGGPRVVFEAAETKSHKALEFDFPEELRPALAVYLGRIHPMLYSGGLQGAPVWPSLHKRKPQMTEHGIYTRITQITTAQLGHPVTPHLFRDAAATFIAELAPERAMMAAAVLQHSDLEMTMAHYIHGQQHLSVHKYHEAIDDLIANVALEPFSICAE
jgi:integrase